MRRKYEPDLLPLKIRQGVALKMAGELAGHKELN